MKSKNFFKKIIAFKWITWILSLVLCVMLTLGFLGFCEVLDGKDKLELFFALPSLCFILGTILLSSRLNFRKSDAQIFYSQEY